MREQALGSRPYQTWFVDHGDKKSNSRQQWLRPRHIKNTRTDPKGLQDYLGNLAEDSDGPVNRSRAIYLLVAVSEPLQGGARLQNDDQDAFPRMEEWPQDRSVLL